MGFHFVSLFHSVCKMKAIVLLIVLATTCAVILEQKGRTTEGILTRRWVNQNGATVDLTAEEGQLWGLFHFEPESHEKHYFQVLGTYNDGKKAADVDIFVTWSIVFYDTYEAGSKTTWIGSLNTTSNNLDTHWTLYHSYPELGIVDIESGSGLDAFHTN